mgnify:CR=1 FL=1
MFNVKIAAKEISNKIVIHGNYVKDEFEVEQTHWSADVA